MPSPQNHDHFNIIVVDDDQLVRDFAVHTIEYGTNRKVVTFDSGFKAWQYIENTPLEVDIIIADANIPDMDGMELLRRVKQGHPDKKFIITTSNPAFETEAGRLGADAFLSKPYDISDLFTVVNQFISSVAESRKTKVALFPNNCDPTTTESG